MRKIITYLIVLSIIQLYSRPMFYFKDMEKSFPDSIKNKNTIVPYPESRVHRAGIFWMNVTNCGVFGNSGFGKDNEYFLDPCTGKIAASGDFPRGSEFEYLSLASIWCGGYLDSSTVNINGTKATVFQGPMVTTGFDGINGYGWSN